MKYIFKTRQENPLDFIQFQLLIKIELFLSRLPNMALEGESISSRQVYTVFFLFVFEHKNSEKVGLCQKHEGRESGLKKLTC